VPSIKGFVVPFGKCGGGSNGAIAQSIDQSAARRDACSFETGSAAPSIEECVAYRQVRRARGRDLPWRYRSGDASNCGAQSSPLCARLAIDSVAASCNTAFRPTTYISFVKLAIKHRYRGACKAW
jgi:hypothetical protein